MKIFSGVLYPTQIFLFRLKTPSMLSTTKEFQDIIAAAPNKHCLLDPVPTSLVKNCALLLALYLSLVFNRSLGDGYISGLQKNAIVKNAVEETMPE